MPKYVDYTELAAHVLCLSPDDIQDIEDGLYEKWQIDLSTFEEIADALIQYTPTLEAPISGARMHVFGTERDGVFIALARTEYTGGP